MLQVMHWTRQEVTALTLTNAPILSRVNLESVSTNWAALNVTVLLALNGSHLAIHVLVSSDMMAGIGWSFQQEKCWGM